MTVTSCAIQPWCCSFFCWSLTSPNVRELVRSGTTQKTQVIYHVNDLDSAPPEWKVPDVQNLAKALAVTDGSVTLRLLGHVFGAESAIRPDLQWMW